MKLLSLFFLLVVAPAAAWTLPTPVTADDSELEEHMHSIEESVKKLRRSLRDPANLEASLALVSTLQRDSLACKDLVPTRAASEPEEGRAEFVRAYRKTMAEFMRAQMDLEIALIDGDADAVSAAFSAIRKLEDPAHERFTNEEH